MKKILLLIASLLVIGFVQAQSDIEEIQMFQSLFGAEKKSFVEQFVKLRSPQKEAFWNLYDQYDAERKALGLVRLDVIRKYAESYATLNNLQTDELMKDIIALKAKNDKLILTYYKKIKKGVDSKTAAQFYQLEEYFLSAIRTAILEEIPLIRQLEGTAK